MAINTHYFLAVPLPDELINKLSFYLKELQQELAFTRWVHPEDLHLTLAFLGVINDEDKKQLTEEMRTIAQHTQPFSLTLKDLGVFGNPQAPRIFWHGIVESIELNQLRDAVYQACERIGFSLDQRKFHPHLTLARKWKGAPFSEDCLTKSHAKTDIFKVEEFILYETHLNKLPKYEKKESFRLELE